MHALLKISLLGFALQSCTVQTLQRVWGNTAEILDFNAFLLRTNALVEWHDPKLHCDPLSNSWIFMDHQKGPNRSVWTFHLIVVVFHRRFTRRQRRSCFTWHFPGRWKPEGMFPKRFHASNCENFDSWTSWTRYGLALGALFCWAAEVHGCWERQSCPGLTISNASYVQIVQSRLRQATFSNSFFQFVTTSIPLHHPR